MSQWDVVFERSVVNGGAPVLSVAGEIDLSVAARFAQELQGLLDDGNDAPLVDLSSVGFIDSSGVRELLKAKTAADAKGQTLVLRAPSPTCRHVLEISGVWGEFEIRDA